MSLLLLVVLAPLLIRALFRRLEMALFMDRDASHWCSMTALDPVFLISYQLVPKYNNCAVLFDKRLSVAVVDMLNKGAPLDSPCLIPITVIAKKTLGLVTYSVSSLEFTTNYSFRFYESIMMSVSTCCPFYWGRASTQQNYSSLNVLPLKRGSLCREFRVNLHFKMNSVVK